MRRSPFFKAFLVTENVPAIYMQEFWATATVHQHFIRFKMDTRKHIVDLEAFREMLHISPRVPGQSFAELPFEEKILEFLRDDILFSTIKVVSRHQNTQQYGAILPIKLTTKDIRNTKAYKEYYACATGEAAPKPKASARRKRGGSASSTTPPTPIATPTPITTIVAAPRLSAAAKHVDDHTKGSDDKEGEKTDESDDDDDQDEAKKVNDDDDDEEEISKIDEQEATESGEGDDEETKSDGESKEQETREQEEESFDPISKTPKGGEDDGDGKEEQGLRISEEERMHEEQEEADELYRDVDINQGRGLQVSQDIDDSYVTLNTIHSDEEQRNLYKALVEAYDADKTILDSYGESAILKRRREEADDQEGPSAGSDRGSKRQREGGEHGSASTPSEPATTSAGRSTIGFETGAKDQPIVQTSQHPEWFSQPRKPPTPDRDWNKTFPAIQGNAQSWISEPINYDKYALWGVSHWGWKRQQFYGFAVNREYALDRRVEDLQLGVESYHKRLNLTNPDTYRSDLKRREAYTAYSNPRGFIYQNRDKKNRLMRIDELHKFSDGTLNDYLPTTIWRKRDKDRAAAMIQAIDKILKTRKIMRSLE
nr:hypothetical protein [Tanacetum cinerariifolium]